MITRLELITKRDQTYQNIDFSSSLQENIYEDIIDSFLALNLFEDAIITVKDYLSTDNQSDGYKSIAKNAIEKNNYKVFEMVISNIEDSLSRDKFILEILKTRIIQGVHEKSIYISGLINYQSMHNEAMEIARYPEDFLKKNQDSRLSVIENNKLHEIQVPNGLVNGKVKKSPTRKKELTELDKQNILINRVIHFILNRDLDTIAQNQLTLKELAYLDVFYTLLSTFPEIIIGELIVNTAYICYCGNEKYAYLGKYVYSRKGKKYSLNLGKDRKQIAEYLKKRFELGLESGEIKFEKRKKISELKMEVSNIQKKPIIFDSLKKEEIISGGFPLIITKLSKEFLIKEDLYRAIDIFYTEYQDLIKDEYSTEVSIIHSFANCLSNTLTDYVVQVSVNNISLSKKSLKLLTTRINKLKTGNIKYNFDESIHYSYYPDIYLKGIGDNYGKNIHLEIESLNKKCTSKNNYEYKKMEAYLEGSEGLIIKGLLIKFYSDKLKTKNEILEFVIA